MAVHLNQCHLVPLARTAVLIQDFYGANLCQASIQSFAQDAAFALRPTVAAIGQAVQDSAVVHADEAGIRIQGKLHWLHCAVTTTLTWLAPHAKRGTQASEDLGLLQGIKGVLVHDGLISYKGLDCTHSLCNAHHIRELVYVYEQENEKIWDLLGAGDDRAAVAGAGRGRSGRWSVDQGRARPGLRSSGASCWSAVKNTTR